MAKTKRGWNTQAAVLLYVTLKRSRRTYTLFNVRVARGVDYRPVTVGRLLYVYKVSYSEWQSPWSYRVRTTSISLECSVGEITKTAVRYQKRGRNTLGIVLRSST